jgi:phosphoglycolate phosphatase-like HAD superfamily hydrolase
MHLIMFDIDGTLLKSNTLDVDCFSGAFHSVMDIDSIEDDWTDFKYVTDEGIVAEIASKQLNRLATGKEISNIRVKIIELLQTRAHANRDNFAPIPGSLELFSSLTEMKNCKVAIATGCWKESAVLKLSTAGFNLENLTIASCDDSHRREEIMSIAYTRSCDLCGVSEFETVTYVGDGVWDIRASRKLGYHFIGLGYYNNEEVLQQEGASYILSDFIDQKAFFERLDEIWASNSSLY